MKGLILLLSITLYTNVLFSQESKIDLTGVWYIKEFRNTHGPNEHRFLTDFTAKKFLGDSLYIGNKINLKHIVKKTKDNANDNELIEFLPKTSCNFSIYKTEEITDINTFLFDNFALRPIQLQLDKNKDKITLIYTDCDEVFLRILYYIPGNKLLIHDFGTFFILTKAE